jgi:photosystem II stability/assembly factor-like uncharacterized protein
MQKNRFYTSLFALMVCLPISASAQSGLDTTILSLAVPESNRTIMYAGTNDGLFIKQNKDWTQLGLDGRYVNDIVIHPQKVDVLYVALGNDGIMKSTNGGKDWTSLSLTASAGGLPPGDIRALAVDKSSPATVYAASFQGHIFKSTDEGQNWTALNANFPISALNAIAVDPVVSGTIYIGTGGNGVYKSTDNGQNWTGVNQGLDDLTITRVLVDPADNARLYAGTYGSGVYMSKDHGQSWQAVSGGLKDAYVYSMAALTSATKSAASARSARKKSGTDLSMAGLVVGVYGGRLYSMTDTSRPDWQPLGEDTRRM